ncbi:iron ABC transporter permease [Rhodoferax sp. TH121]|uniref:ABC transporter permease n=1 Tax=Rhodoferax sp. TH121 TaxID=2022803 RepID=UPI000B9629A5|nr:iron ABC transporter permease [Rhodoferax sp. TH121]OYQ41359.1 iron ABC transporter permease [Rhodoferax sp. TH121]
MTHTHPWRLRRAIALWAALGLVAFMLLPWYFLQNGGLWGAMPGIWGKADTASAWVQAWSHHRVWLWSGLAGLLLAGAAALSAEPRSQGLLLCSGATVGLAGVLLSGFAIGMVGWSWDWLNAMWGSTEWTQPGMGWGGFVVVLSLLALLAIGVARLGGFKGDAFVAGAVLVCAALLALFVVYPVIKSLMGSVLNDEGQFALGALWERIGTARIWGLGCVTGGGRCGVAWNTLGLALMTAAGTTFLGTLIALWAEREAKRLARPLNILAMLPIITPPFVVGLGLILLFGRAGLYNQFMEWAFGIEPTRWFYGFFGVWLAQLFAFTPIAFMIMRGVVQGVSPSMEEASQTLRANRMQTFWSVTLPLLKPGLANAFLVGFIESMADFGNPIVVGGQFAVLSTEIFFAIVGSSLDPGMAAALSLILTLFALAVFFIQRRVLGKGSYTTVAGKGDAGLPMPLPDGIRKLCLGVAGPWLLFTLVVYLFAFAGGFVQTWGRDYTLTLNHFRTAFDVQWGDYGWVWAGTAWNSLFTTLSLAAMAAPICAGMGLLIAWLLARTEFRGKATFEFSALLTFAVPGTVLGVSYILAFNVPPVELTGTGLIIVLCFVFRNLPVGVRAGTAAFKQLDRSLDEASLMLRANTLTTLRLVVLPLIKSALVAALVYSFVRSITTVSAVIFLVTAKYELSTTYIIGRVGNGDYGVALAYCTVLIVLMSLSTLLVQALVGERKLGRRATPAAH